MKHTKLRQLIKELIKEAYVDSKGELKRFKTIDDEEGEGTTEWIAGLQRVANFLRSIPKLKELRFTEPMVRIIRELEHVIGFWVDGSEEKQQMLDSIPGDTIGQKAEVAALGAIMHKHDMIFNLHVAPYLGASDLSNPDDFMDDDDLFEGLTTTEFDLDIIKAVGKKLAQLGIIK